jgi:hypothetical protein
MFGAFHLFMIQADSCIHRPAAEDNPASNDPVHEPEPDQRHQQPRDEEADPDGCDDEAYAERGPEQAEPEDVGRSEIQMEPAGTNCSGDENSGSERIGPAKKDIRIVNDFSLETLFSP